MFGCVLRDRAISSAGYCVVADTRMSTGFGILTPDYSKIHQIMEKAILASSGFHGDIRAFCSNSDARYQINQHQHRKRRSCLAMAQLLSNNLYYKRSLPYYAFNVLLGLTNEARPGVRRMEMRKGLLMRAARSGGDEPAAEIDVSVFRFTLGIPGFDDADLPKLVGILFGSLLLLNHVFSLDSMTGAQLRSESLGLCLAATAICLPEIGRRLKRGEAEKKGNRIVGRRSIFELADKLTVKQKQELAWGSYALLQNTRTSSMMVWHDAEVVCARGSWDVGDGPESGGARTLPLLLDMLKKTPFIDSSDPIYVPSFADTKGWAIVQKDAKSMIVQPFAKVSGISSIGNGGLILLSCQLRSYSSKDRTWVAILAQKFSGVLEK